MKLKYKILLLMALVTLLASALFTYILYTTRNKTLIGGIDQKLLSAAYSAKYFFGKDYHDNIVDANSVSDDEYREIVDTCSRLCVELNIQSIFSVMDYDGRLVFTSSTSVSKDASKSDYPTFFMSYPDPELFTPVLETMKIEFLTLGEQQEHGRMVLIPDYDKNGRKYIFAASIGTEEIGTLKWENFKHSIFIGMIIAVVGILISLPVSSLIVRPIAKLANVAQAIAEGDLGRTIDVKGETEFVFLAKSINQLRTVAKERIAALTDEVRDRKTADEELKYRFEFEKLITSISTEFINLDPDEIDDGINKALEKLIDYACTDRGYVFLYSADGISMSNTHEVCRKGIPPFIRELQDIPLTHYPWFTKKMKNFESVCISNIDDMPAEADDIKQTMIQQSILSLICVPLVSRNKLAGFLGFDAVLYQKQWGDDTITLLRIVGEIFANTLNRRQSEQAIRKSEQMLESILNTIPVRVFWKDVNSVFLGCNQLFAADAGLHSPPEIVGKTDYELAWKDYAVLYRKDDAAVIKTGIPRLGYEEPYASPDGKSLWVRTNKTPLRNPDGETIGVLGTLEDITERKRGEHALRMSEQRFRAIADYTYDWENWFSPKGKAIWISSGVERVSGYTVEECMEMADYPMQLACDEDVENLEKAFESALKGSSGKSVEFSIRRKDGDVIRVSMSWQPIFDQNGVSQGHRSIIHDVTEQKNIEEKIRESEHKYRTLVETMTEGLKMENADFVLTFVNDQLCNILGYGKDELLGHSLLEFVHQDYLEAMEKQIELRKNGINKSYELAWKTKTGQKLYTIVSPKAFFDKNGNLTGSIGVVTDITERKKSEAEMEYLLKDLAAKNEELESIVYISSHDLRSPLINIQGYDKELKYSCDELEEIVKKVTVEDTDKQRLETILNKEIPDSLKYISDSATKIDRLLNALLKLSRLGRTAMQIKHIDMNELIKDVIGTFQYVINERKVNVTVDNLPSCIGDLNLIKQVFANIIDNSIKYLDPQREGRIHISGYCEKKMSTYSIEDNGIGIDASHYETIFEIFHQLNPEKTGGGEGLGLTIVRRILDRNNGKIRIESQPGKGSTFYVSLPGLIKIPSARSGGESTET